MFNKTKTKRIIALIALTTLTFSQAYADDQSDVKTHINNMQNSTNNVWILWEIFTKVFDSEGKIKEVFLAFTNVATNWYLPMWDTLKLVDSPLFVLAWKVWIWTELPTETLTLSWGLSLTKDPDSWDDVWDRDYNDTRYVWVAWTAADSNLLDWLDSLAFQRDVAWTTCANGIESIADNGTVVCSTSPWDTNAWTECLVWEYLDWDGTCKTERYNALFDTELEIDAAVSNNGYDSTADTIADDGIIQETEIAQNTLDDTEIEDDSLTASSLAIDSVWNSELASSAVDSTNIVNDTITETDIIDSFVARDSDKLDTLDSTQFLRSDESDLMSGSLDVNGVLSFWETGYEIKSSKSVWNVTSIIHSETWKWLELRANNDSYNQFILDESWNVGINKTNPWYKLEVNGTMNSTTLYEGTVSLVSKYLGILAKATDSDKLDGIDSTWFIQVWTSWDQLQDGTIDSSEIEDNTITGTDILNSTITGTDISNNSLTADDLAVGSVWTSEVQDNSLTSADINDNSLTSTDIFNNTITEDDISDSFKARDSDKLDWIDSTRILTQRSDIGSTVDLNSYLTTWLHHQNSNASAAAWTNYPEAQAWMLEVVEDGDMVYQKYHVYNGTWNVYFRTKYTTTWNSWKKMFRSWDSWDLIADGTIDASEIQDNTISAADLAPSSVWTSEIADNTITALDILNSTITAADLAANSVWTSEVQDNTLTATDLAVDSVWASELANDSVASANIIANTITAADLATSSVATAEILDNTITETDISDSFKARDSDKLDAIDSTQFVRSDVSDTVAWSLSFTNTNGILWESWVNRITHNDWGWNVQIRFWHDYSSTDERFTHAWTAYYIGWSVDAAWTSLDLKVATNGWAWNDAAVTWWNVLSVWPSNLTWWGNNILVTWTSWDNIADGTIDGSEIQDNTIAAADIATGWVWTSEILDNSISETDISDSFKARDSDKLDALDSTQFLRSDASDTTSWDLKIIKNRPTLVLDSANAWSNTDEQSARLTIWESGENGSAALHLTYTWDWYGHIGMGSMTSTDATPAYEALKFYYQNNDVTALWNLSVTVNPDSWDDVWDRDYNDARYINVWESWDSILDGTIDASEIQDNTISAADLAASSVWTSEIADNTVSSSDILNNTITETDISDSFKARDSDKLDAIDSTQFVRSDTSDVIASNHEFYGTDITWVYWSAPIEIREVNNVTTAQSSEAYAPAITWHWGGRQQWQLSLESDWVFHFRDWVTHTNLKSVNAASYQENGTALSSKYLGISAKAADSEKVDGINGASLLRSDVNDNLTAAIIVPTANRDEWMFGTYDSTKTQHIWSMWTGYRNSAAGTNFGNLYGLAYKHTNNTTGWTMAWGHQMVWAQNWNGTSAMGTNIWTSWAVIVDSSTVIWADAWIEWDRIRQWTVDGSEIQDNSLYAADIAADSIWASELANNSVASANVVDNSLTATDLAANSCWDSELIDTPTFTNINVLSGNSNWLRFWSSNSYKISMWNATENHYGPVNGYSINSAMSSTVWRWFTWWVTWVAPVAALEVTTWNMQIKWGLKTTCIWNCF